MHCHRLLVVVLSLALAPPSLANDDSDEGSLPVLSDLGSIVFPNSGAVEAQDAFLRGMLLLHSFEYDDAAEAFGEAQQADPEFALAYWGEALTHSHPLWQQNERDAAQEVLGELGPTPQDRQARCKTPREAGLLDAVEQLFSTDQDDRHLRNVDYSEAMGRLHETYPDDHEIQTLYALSLLGTSEHGRDARIYMRAASVAEEVYAENPRHPGALHYLIHSYDDPVHAPLGLRMARRYDVVAPAASHALHMPSHIYVALGMWDDSERANIASAAAADARRERRQLDLENRGYHALWWLLYTRLQQGRYAEARPLLDDMVRDEAAGTSKRTRFHLAAMRAAWLVETEEWDGPAVSIAVDVDEMSLAWSAAHDFSTALAALRRGDVEEATRVRAQLRTRMIDVIAQLANEIASGDAARDPGTGRRPDVDPRGDEGALPPGDPSACCLPAATVTGPIPPGRRAALVMEQLLEALLIARADGLDAAEDAFAEALAGEDAMTYDFGPPVVVKPAHELYGELLLDAARTDEAVEQFEIALARAPRRARALLGLARAREALGDTVGATEAWTELDDVWHQADPELRALLPASFATR